MLENKENTLWIICMKILFWSVIVFSSLVSSSVCASVVVDRRPSQVEEVPSQKYLAEISKEDRKIEIFIQEQLEIIRNSYGHDACDAAITILSSIPEERNQVVLQAIFDAIKVGAKSSQGKSLPVKITQLQEFEKIFKDNSTPSWGLEELQKNIPGAKDEIDALRLDKLNPDCWDVIEQDLAKKIEKGNDNKQKFSIAMDTIKGGIEMFSQLHGNAY